jgi:hypothetical protein
MSGGSKQDDVLSWLGRLTVTNGNLAHVYLCDGDVGCGCDQRKRKEPQQLHVLKSFMRVLEAATIEALQHG